MFHTWLGTENFRIKTKCEDFLSSSEDRTESDYASKMGHPADYLDKIFK